MADAFFTITLVPGKTKRFIGIRKRMLEGLAKGAGVAVMDQMQLRSNGSIDVQFRTETTISGTGNITWPKTKPFGNKPAPAKTLQRTGALYRAWTGKSNNTIRRKSKGKVEVGAGGNVALRARIFQSGRRGGGGPVKQKVTAKQQAFLSGRFGVWFPIGYEIVNPMRPVAVNKRMVNDSAQAAMKYFVGERTGQGGTP